MATSHAEEIPLHLAGNNAPVAHERLIRSADIDIVGEIPSEIAGVFYRNGPNPQTGQSEHLFDGDGMVHAVEIADGAVTRYMNRFVRTPLLDNPGVPRFALAVDAASGQIDYRVTTANTSIVFHSGRLLALEEGGFPYELSADLHTVGPFTFDGRLTSPMTAHPKRCPLTGELLFFGYQVTPPYLTFYRAAADGRLVTIEPIDLRRPTMMHDFAVTASSVVFLDSPIVFDWHAATSGGSPWRWHDHHGARFGVMPRSGTNIDVRWYEVEAAHVSHVANAYDTADGRIVVTGTRIGRDRADHPGGFGGGLPTMHRWIIDRPAGTTTEAAIDDLATEYPRIDDRLIGQHNRYVYSTTFSMDAEPDHSSIIRYDIDDGSSTSHRFAAGQTCGEAVFVARGDDDDGGVLMTFVHDRATGSSSLVVLDAGDLAAAPIAEIRLPVRVPAGFHGTWVPRDR